MGERAIPGDRETQIGARRRGRGNGSLLSGVAAAALAVAVLGAVGLAGAQDTVHFPSSDADLTGGPATPLSGLLLRPPGEGPFAAVVLLHGCGGLHDGNGRLTSRHDDWARRLRDRGWVVLLVDSFGPRGVREICTSRARPVEPARERARDAYGGLVHLQQQRFVRADRIALLGWSNGGSTVLWTIATGAQRPPGLAHDFRAAVAFYPGCRAALAAGSWATRIPLLVLVGEKDDWTPARPCVDLAEGAKRAGEPVEIVTYPGAFHYFDAPDVSLRVRQNIAGTKSGTATIGTDPAARADAIRRVPEYLARHLAP
jgi:dienelactone hydrolase